MPKVEPEYGMSSNNIPYVKWGSGDKTMLIFTGGPGDSIPKGIGFRMMTSSYDPFIEDYTIYMLNRKRGLAEGYTTRDMSDDYADMINADLGGFVDVIIGTSFGGIISQYFAADHYDLCNHIVICIAAHKMSDKGKKTDLRFAKLLSEGKNRQAAVSMADIMNHKGIAGFLFKMMMWIFGGSFLKADYDTFSKDVLIEAEAEVNHDVYNSLSKINKPVLIVCGDNDYYFPKEYVNEMHSLIKDSILKLYEGKGHMNVLTDKRFTQDVIEFISR